jgi:hypothetical protein
MGVLHHRREHIFADAAAALAAARQRHQGPATA